jgi:hypothetical protein
MRSRSDVMKAKKTGEAEPKDKTLTCPACTAQVESTAATPRNQAGDIECHECGCAIPDEPLPAKASTPVDAPPEASKTTADLAAEEDAKKKPDPAKRYCGRCGTELTWAASTYFYACGHVKADAGVVDDPRDAKGEPVPSPHRTRADAETAKRNAEDPRTPTLGSESSNRLVIPWGKARLPIDRFNGFEVGGFIASVDLAPGEDRVAAAKKILDDLEEIADLAFQRQHIWYAKKLKLLGHEGE